MTSRYEYKWIEVDNLDALNKLGDEGWRVVPSISRLAGTSGRRYEVLMELIKEPKDTVTQKGDDLEIPAPEEPVELCGARRAAGWGSGLATCSFPKGHEENQIPHSWVPTC